MHNVFFNVLFGLSIFLLAISQLVFLPVLLFLYLFFVSIFRGRVFGFEDYLFWLFIFFSFISFIFAKHKDVAIGGVIILIFYYIAFFVGKNGDFSFRSICWGATFFVVIGVIFGVIFYFLKDFSFFLKVGNVAFIEIPPSSMFSYSSIVRSSSITPNPVIFSSSVLYLSPLIISWLFLKFGSRKILFYLTFSILVFFEFVVGIVSNSRSFIILFPILVVLILVLLRRYEGIIVFLFLVLVLFLLFWGFLSDSVFRRFLEIIFGHWSLMVRVDGYKESIGLFKDHLFFGIGLVNFKFYVPYYFGNYIHNLYLSILVETGLLGFISFMSLIFYLVYRSFRTVINDVIKVGYFVSVVFFLLHGFFDNTLYVFSLGIMFWFFMGILLRGNKDVVYKLN